MASKRPEALIEAMPLVYDRMGSSVIFLFVGDGPERAACEEMVTRLGVADQARFIGATPHAEVPEVMAASDIFVSTSNLTNMAIPTCEAMICGLPVVAFDVGNTRDVVKDGETGYAVEDSDIPALADAIVRLLTDPAARTSMGASGRKLAREKFTGWDERIDTEIEIIRSTIRNFRRP